MAEYIHNDDDWGTREDSDSFWGDSVGMDAEQTYSEDCIRGFTYGALELWSEVEDAI